MPETYNRESAIAAQNAGSSAATLVASLVTANFIDSVDEAISVYENVRKNIFDGTLSYAGAEAFVQSFTDAPASSGNSAPAASSDGGGRNKDPGTVVLKFGKHAGKTLAQVGDEDPDWVEWAAENATNDFVKRVTNEYLGRAA